MGYKYKSYEERRAAKKARNAHHTQVRSDARKKTLSKTKGLLQSLQYIMKRCGLRQIELADFSGISPSSLNRIARTRHTSIQLSTYISIANACGYELKLVAKKPENDEFRAFRMVRLVDVEGK